MPMRQCLIAVLLLAGCATTPDPAPVALTATQHQQLQQLDKALAGGIITRDQYNAQRKKIVAPH